MKKTTLITGASGGLGREFARIFAREGYDLVLVARSERKLERIASECAERFGAQTKIVVKDLSLPSAPEEIYADLARESISVDVLVNNAGTQVYGPFVENDARKELQMIRVNVTALTHLTELFLPDMVERGAGKILNVGSTGSFVPGPLNAVYCATKSYVLSLSEAIAEELNDSDVTVTALCPGPINTEFATKHGLEESNLFTGPGVLEAPAVAEAGYEALMDGKRVLVPGAYNKLQVLAARFLPRRLLIRLAKRVMRSP